MLGQDIVRCATTGELYRLEVIFRRHLGFLIEKGSPSIDPPYNFMDEKQFDAFRRAWISRSNKTREWPSDQTALSWSHVGDLVCWGRYGFAGHSGTGVARHDVIGPGETMWVILIASSSYLALDSVATPTSASLRKQDAKALGSSRLKTRAKVVWDGLPSGSSRELGNQSPLRVANHSTPARSWLP